MVTFTKNFDFNLRRDHEKISYERRAYESVDKSLEKRRKNEFGRVKVKKESKDRCGGARGKRKERSQSEEQDQDEGGAALVLSATRGEKLSDECDLGGLTPVMTPFGRLIVFVWRERMNQMGRGEMIA